MSKNSSATSQATAKAAIHVTNEQELYDAVDDPNNAGASILLRGGITPTQTYVLTRRLLLQKDMKLYGLEGEASAIKIDTRSIPDADLTEGGLRVSSIGVGLGTNAVEWLTIIGNPQAAGGIGADLPGTDPTTIRIANVVSGEESDAFNSRGIDIRNLRPRAVTVEIEQCEFFGQRQGIRFANFTGVANAHIHAEMRNNHSHGNRTGCLIVNNGALKSSVEVDSTLDTFDDNAAGCVIYGGFGNANGNFARLGALGSRFENNRRTEVDTERGGVVAIGGRVVNNQSNASRNKVLVHIEDCSIVRNHIPNFPAYGARNTASANPTVAGTENSVLIELQSGDQSTIVTEIPSDPSEATPTNTVEVVRL